MLERVEGLKIPTGLTGLIDRLRPAIGVVRGWTSKGLKRSAPFSSLQRLIIFFNLIGLTVLVAGMMYLSDNQRSVIEVYVDSLRKQGDIISISIAESARETEDGYVVLDTERASSLLAELVKPIGTRVRLYDPRSHLIADTYILSEDSGRIEVEPLAPPGEDSGELGTLGSLYQSISSFFWPEAELYSEVPTIGASRETEVLQAAQGAIVRKVRMNSEGELVVSLAMPVVRLKAIIGVLQLSTRGGEIEQLVHKEHNAVIEIFFLAAIVSVLLSIVLANLIASPIRLLARAARVEGSSEARPLSPERPAIPDLTDRTDEIGELSGALISMTNAIYNRIGAIESFASDVAHEIKNPLTSLRSAVETIQYAKTDEQRQQLIDVIMNDCARLDRLITDISNASRLDAELARERMDTVDVGKLIEMLAEVTENNAVRNRVMIITNVPPGPFQARGLEGRLAQVITNLLTNAVSFSPAGGKITVTGEHLEKGGIRVRVEDEGPGVPPENLESIFERFYSERPQTETFGNHSGLGLSICKQIIETHGGRIWAENLYYADDPDGDPIGACFTFELPG